MMLRGMNCGHARVAGMGHDMLEWMPQWDALDIGCGGGANISRMLKLCSRGRVCGSRLVAGERGLRPEEKPPRLWADAAP